MARIFIIGCGNPLRGDDGLGWRAAESLAAALRKSNVAIVMRHQLTPELADPISRAALVIFIDATQQGPAGTVFCQSIIPAVEPAGAFSHQLTPRALLSWSRDLYGLCPEAVVFCVSGRSFDCGEELSPAVASALPQLIERICAFVEARERCSSSSAGLRS
jgi:hydrogenase maturation protease